MIFSTRYFFLSIESAIDLCKRFSKLCWLWFECPFGKFTNTTNPGQRKKRLFFSEFVNVTLGNQTQNAQKGYVQANVEFLCVQLSKLQKKKQNKKNRSNGGGGCRHLQISLGREVSLFICKKQATPNAQELDERERISCRRCVLNFVFLPEFCNIENMVLSK